MVNTAKKTGKAYFTSKTHTMKRAKAKKGKAFNFKKRLDSAKRKHLYQLHIYTIQHI